MKINFSCTGGFANIALEYHKEIEDLPDDLADEILELIADAGLLSDESAPQETSDKVLPDAISYQLKLSREFHTTEITCSDVTAPEQLRPLLSRLRRLAIAEKRASYREGEQDE